MKKILIIIFISIISNNVYSQEIKWISMEEAESLNKKEPKKIIVKLYTSWCGWCKKMDRDTYGDKEIINYINENFYAVKLNGEEKKSITFSGREYKFVDKGRRGYNELAVALTSGKLSYPSSSFIDEKNQVLTTVPGYLGAEDFLPILKYFGSNAYKTKSWKEYSEK